VPSGFCTHTVAKDVLPWSSVAGFVVSPADVGVTWIWTPKNCPPTTIRVQLIRPPPVACGVVQLPTPLPVMKSRLLNCTLAGRLSLTCTVTGFWVLLSSPKSMVRGWPTVTGFGLDPWSKVVAGGAACAAGATTKRVTAIAPTTKNLKCLAKGFLCNLGASFLRDGVPKPALMVTTV
jgi:hypothetical protein